MCRSGLLRGSPRRRGNPRSRAWRSRLPYKSASSADFSPSQCKCPHDTLGRPPRQRIRKDSLPPRLVPAPLPVFSVVERQESGCQR